MIKIEIKNRFTESILFVYEKTENTLKQTVLEAIKSDADLRGANLRGANLGDANLRGANLRLTKADFWEILLNSKSEIAGLKNSLLLGNVDGSTYTGDCCCLIGTIANVNGCAYTALPGITPDPSRPAERWFLAIKKGHSPENSQVVKQTVMWIDELLLLIGK